MIAIVSTVTRERAAYMTLCEARGWTVAECDAVQSFKQLLRRTSPKVVLVRQKLDDGYSDDVLAAIRATPAGQATKVLVLLTAGSSASTEARQISLGADCVQRDPVRTEVLLAYLEKYYNAVRASRRSVAVEAKNLRFADAVLQREERKLRNGTREVVITPREVDLVELLARSNGQVLSYEALFNEILGRRFRGDTSNMRVLLGKLIASTASIGISLRDWVEVIPKLGYRYSRPKRSKLRLSKDGAALLSAA